MKHALAPWLEAVRTLPDNPWLGYLRLTERRRVARLPLWRRRLFLIVTAGVAFSVLLTELLTLGGASVSAEVRDNVLLVLLVPIGGLWLLGHLGRANAACLSMLALRQERTLAGQFEDGIALGEMTDQQFVVGTLAQILPRIWLGVAVAGFLLWQVNVQLYSGPTTSSEPSHLYRQQLNLLETQGIWLWLSFVLNGLLASTILGFILIAVGRRVRFAASLPLVSTALLFHVIGHSASVYPIASQNFLYWISLPVGLSSQAAIGITGVSYGLPETLASTGLEGPESQLASVGAVLAIIALGVGWGLRGLGWRGLLLLLVLIPLPVYLLAFSRLYYGYSWGYHALWAEYVAPWLLIGLGALNPLDPLAFQLPVPLLAGEEWPWPRETLYWPLQLGAQVVLLVLTASLAARSVRLSRSGE